MVDDKRDCYDVAIVGGGPAGSTAAYILGRKGYKVIILDKARFPREKLCGGCLTAKTMRFLDRVFNEPIESLLRQNIIDFKSDRFGIRYKTRTLIDRPSPLTFYFVKRSVYDDFLLHKVKQSGAEVLENEKVIGIEIEGDKNKLITATGRTVTARFIIGADGVNSVTRTLLFHRLKDKRNIPAWKHNLATSLEIYLPRSGELESLDYPILVFGYLCYGYAWIFPNIGRIVVGMGGLNRKNDDITGAFKRFLSDYNVLNQAPRKFNGYLLPYGNFMTKPVWGNILLAGDAAGLVDPMLGEGIFQAHKSGELAAQAIIETLENNTVLESIYSNLLEATLLKEFTYARRSRGILYNPLSRLFNYRIIKPANRYFDKLVEVIHGDRAYRWFKRSKT